MAYIHFHTRETEATLFLKKTILTKEKEETLNPVCMKKKEYKHTKRNMNKKLKSSIEDMYVFTLQSLPPEVVKEEIGTHLSDPHLLNFSETNKEFRDTTRDIRLYRYYSTLDYKELYNLYLNESRFRTHPRARELLQEKYDKIQTFHVTQVETPICIIPQIYNMKWKDITYPPSYIDAPENVLNLYFTYHTIEEKKTQVLYFYKEGVYRVYDHQQDVSNERIYIQFVPKEEVYITFDETAFQKALFLLEDLKERIPEIELKPSFPPPPPQTLFAF